MALRICGDEDVSAFGVHIPAESVRKHWAMHRIVRRGLINTPRVYARNSGFVRRTCCGVRGCGEGVRQRGFSDLEVKLRPLVGTQANQLLVAAAWGPHP